MDRDRYLERIGYDGPLEPGLETLRRLHLEHLRRVPFENLDIHLGTPLSLELPELYAKIVERRRGGFCYELNGLFAWLLRDLGFDVARLSARVVGGDGEPGEEFEHMTLLVRLDGAEWLADVGFGECFTEPVAFDPATRPFPGAADHRVVRREPPALALDQRGDDGTWAAQYVFTTKPRRMEEYGPMCRYFETSPDSHFRRKRLCTRLTEEGRLTLSELRLIETRAGVRTEVELGGEAEWQRKLAELFGVELPPGGLGMSEPDDGSA